MDVVPYDADWLPELAALVRAHARLVPPRVALSDEEVARGLTRHAYWPFYTAGLAGGQTLLAVEDGRLLAAAQAGYVDSGWGYGAAPGDGPEWLRDVHVSLFWLLAWPGWREASTAAALLAARVVGWARNDGLPGVECFRGGPGFLPFGTQLSSFWPHLYGPLRAAGFRQPRDLLVYAGETEPDALPALAELPDLVMQTRRGRIEAWWHGEPVGVCAAARLGRAAGEFADERMREWAAIRRLVVAEEVRGRGIGSALFAEQLRRLAASGVKRYLLHIPDDPQDQPARALYAKFGALADCQQVLRLSF